MIDLYLPSSKKVLVVLVTIILALVFLSTLGQLAKYYFGYDYLMGFVPLFFVDYESNIPTWFSSAMLLTASVLLLFIAMAKSKENDLYRFQWALLAAIFFYLSIDETAMLHEYPIAPLRRMFNAGGFLYFTWVVPALIILGVLGIYFLKFTIHLPALTRRLFITAAAFYIGGAIGFEMISGFQIDLYGPSNMRYVMIITAEESCEMLGVAIFIVGLRQYLPQAVESITINLK